MAESGTLLESLVTNAAAAPERRALQAGRDALSYEQFVARIGGAAAFLRSHGVGAQDRVIICAANSLMVPTLYFAVHSLNAIAVPLPPDTPFTMLCELAADAEACLAVVDRNVPGMPCPVVAPASTVASAPSDVTMRSRPDAVADLLYTTGTTGRKKGVVLTHANVMAAATNITAFIGNRRDDVEVVPLPLSHSFGLGRLRSLAVAGNTLILEPGVGSGAIVVKRLQEERATGLAMVPAGFEILRRMTGDEIGKTHDHLRYIEIGSAAMRPETRDWLQRQLPHTRICHHYGLTEASRAAFTDYRADAHKKGTVGRAAPNVEITICDEAGRPVTSGQPGEVFVRGGMVMREYWKQPELSRAVLTDGGMRTGDLGCMDADGYLFLLGRRSDVINVGGRKVAPDEVEALLCQLDGVRDAGCVGEPDDLLGEHVKAFVVAEREIGRAEVVAFLRARVEECKIPAAVQRIAEIPRTSSGKIQRHKLRDVKGVA